mmetsp:Transcript_28266/g.64023  ORF Transcript_28266/g.64023 Transcript_28266/m.64023 type:complete len:103 (+) Transcript_28266:161-469(+)
MAEMQLSEEELIERCQVHPYPERRCRTELKVSAFPEGGPPPVSGALQNAIQERYWNTEIWYHRPTRQIEVKHTEAVRPEDILERLQQWGQKNQAEFELVKST